MSRPDIYYRNAIEWLKMKFERAVSIPVSEVKRSAPASFRTMRRAKKKLGLISFQAADGWHWKQRGIFDVPGERPIDKTVQDIFVPQEQEEFDPELATTTKDMLELANFLFVDGKTKHEIVAEVVATAARWPNRLPYPKEYIESIVAYIADGTPVRQDLNPNSN